MMIYRTDDPLADFDRHDTEESARLKRLPVCSECGNPIQDEYMYLIDGEPICEECLNKNYRKYTEDYIK